MPSKKPTLTVVIPHLNYGRYLRQCLDSLYNQSFKDFEVILVDGGSKDETFKVLKDFPKVKVLVDVPARGPVRAVNKGIAVMNGSLFVQLNSDCWLDSDCYERLVAAFDANPKLGMAYCGWNVVDDDGQTVGYGVQPKTFQRDRLLRGNFIDASGMMIRTGCLWNVGLFDERCPNTMDWLMAAKVSRLFPVAFVDVRLFYYRVHKDQITANPKAKADAKKCKKIMRPYFSREAVLKARLYDAMRKVI